jgi:hypothetical protein
MRMVGLPFLGLAIVALAHPAAAQHRELGAHEHGRGTLNIAVEGARVSMELEAPGADIVGFEHAAKTRTQKAAVEKGKKLLSAPQTLFKLPASAGCVVKEASAKVEGEDQDHDHAKDATAKDSKAKDDAPKHSEFHATYTFECKSPANITAIEFDYFRTFPGAQKLDVTVITSKGQTKFEVTRAKPRIDLAGMM